MGKRISRIIMTVFYIAAGINHFRNPAIYYTLIPPYLPNPVLINIISGVAEIILGLLLIFPKTRRIAVYGIIALLIAFIPAHIYMIQNGWCMGNGFCLPVWATWVRLFPLQFLLMWWAWWHRGDIRVK
jgi:uncharacterized membrane protein